MTIDREEVENMHRQISIWENSSELEPIDSLPQLTPQTLQLPDADIVFYPSIFSPSESDRLYADLYTQTAWQEKIITIQGRSIPIPRLTAWYGDAGGTYTYSGITMTPEAWTPTLLQIKTKVEQLSGTPFNSVLLNLYRNGRDSVAWHSDDEPELGQNPVIASVSLGATRRFALKHKHRKDLKQTIDLFHGSCLLMQGSTQHYWQHQIPKTAKPVAARINLTFRLVSGN